MMAYAGLDPAFRLGDTPKTIAVAQPVLFFLVDRILFVVLDCIAPKTTAGPAPPGRFKPQEDPWRRQFDGTEITHPFIRPCGGVDPGAGRPLRRRAQDLCPRQADRRRRNAPGG